MKIIRSWYGCLIYKKYKELPGIFIARLVFVRNLNINKNILK